MNRAGEYLEQNYQICIKSAAFFDKVIAFVAGDIILFSEI
jgi:hypothetical protein